MPHQWQRKPSPPDTPKEWEEVPQKERWAKVAEEMASHGYMSGKTGEKMFDSIRELWEGFEIRDPYLLDTNIISNLVDAKQRWPTTAIFST